MPVWLFASLGKHMHTNLKGRIFSNEGVSYLVLQEESESPDWLRVRVLDPTRRVERMRAEDVQRCVTGPRPQSA